MPLTPSASAPSALLDFVEQLRRLVLDESAATRQNIYRIWSKPIPSRVAEGHAIEGIRFVRQDKTGDLHLAFDRNWSRFREGDILALNRGDPLTNPGWMVTLEREEPQELIVSPGVVFDIEALAREPTDWMLDEGFLDLSPYTLAVLDQVSDTTVGRERILPLLLGQRHPTMDAPHYERGLSYGDVFHLNWAQSEALAQAYATDLAYLIQGPPGTGKTRVLAHIAQLLAEEGERVLITAATHRAINNALNKLAEVAPDVTSLKIGQAIQADDLRVENCEYFGGCPLEDLEAGYVIGGTPYALRTKRLQGVQFETIIFDEASQITLPLAMMAMLSGKKYIFIGDHKQLPPVFQTRSAGDPLLRTSVFGALAGRGFDTLLTETYRLNAELAEWPSRSFYQSALVPAACAVDRRIQYDVPPTRFKTILDAAAVRVFVDLRHRNSTTSNQLEASAVVDLVLALLECGVPPQEIGIVAPYRAQGRTIRSLLQDALPDASLRRRIVTDTVERLQGQERDVVLVSLTTSNPAFAAELAEFFFQPERLNVAVTRPRKKLIILGSLHVLTAQPDDPDLMYGVELLRDLIKQCAYRAWESE